jgi:hypothetical protein
MSFENPNFDAPQDAENQESNTKKVVKGAGMVGLGLGAVAAGYAGAERGADIADQVNKPAEMQVEQTERHEMSEEELQAELSDSLMRVFPGSQQSGEEWNIHDVGDGNSTTLSKERVRILMDTVEHVQKEVAREVRLHQGNPEMEQAIKNLGKNKIDNAIKATVAKMANHA